MRPWAVKGEGMGGGEAEGRGFEIDGGEGGSWWV